METRMIRVADDGIDRNCELAGKVAIVTGSARNIGRGIATELAKAGASVVINAVKDKELCETVAHDIQQSGGTALPVMADVTNQDDVDRMVRAATNTLGGVDILINNAAVRTRTHFSELTFEEWERLRNVALDGGLRMSMACVPHMVARGGGSVIGIHGLSSYSAGPNAAHKAAVKCGMAGMIRGMARDLGPLGITCNVAVVGRFDTDRESGSGDPNPANRNVDIPIGRMGTPQDMADLVRFLVGPFARYISGQTIHLNGAAFMPH